MGYYKQFDYFDPLTGKFPSWIFPQGSSIVYRARSILRGRTLDQIHDIANDADQIISEYFDQEKESLIALVQSDGRYDLLVGDEDGNFSGLKDEAAEHYDLRGPDNTSDLDALQEAIGPFFDPNALEIDNLKDFEYFAVLALWLIGDFVRDYETEYDFALSKHVPRPRNSINSSDTARAARHLIDAMESVCYAERLRAVEQTHERYQRQIQRMQAAHHSVTDEDIARIRAQVLKDVEEEAKARRIEQARENSRRRHQENNDVKQQVLDEWEQHPTQFSSAEKAGAHYVGVLAKRGIEREHRTVVGWIRARAKELGIRFR